MGYPEIIAGEFSGIDAELRRVSRKLLMLIFLANGCEFHRKNLLEDFLEWLQSVGNSWILLENFPRGLMEH